MEPDADLNRSLMDVIELLQREIARLRESLEAYRLSDHPERQRLIRYHVRSLDERQDALEKVQAAMEALAEEQARDHPH